MTFVYQCTACRGEDQRNRYQGSFVCHWCGDGVMQFIEEYEEEDSAIAGEKEE